MDFFFLNFKFANIYITRFIFFLVFNVFNYELFLLKEPNLCNDLSKGNVHSISTNKQNDNLQNFK